jgi:hypothetical protein
MESNPFQRRLPFGVNVWADHYYTKGKLRIEKKLHNQKKCAMNKSIVSGTQLEYDVWLLCERLAKVGIEMHYQYPVNGGVHIADIFLCRVQHGRYGGRNVILSIKDVTGRGSHGQKITNDIEGAKSCRLPIEVIHRGSNIPTSVLLHMEQNRLEPISIDDFPEWVERVSADQQRPIEDFVKIRKRG